jgi:hypothetical protein
MDNLSLESACVKCGSDTTDSLFCGSCGTAVLHNLLVKSATTADYDPRGQDYAPWREPVTMPPRLLKPMDHMPPKVHPRQPYVICQFVTL